MGIFHVYCSICDGPTIMDTDPFVDRDEEYSDEEDSESLIPRLDPELVTSKSISWITRMRIVGLNRESGSSKHCFISGEGTCNDTGVFFACERTDDPCFPNEEQLAIAPGDVPEFRVCYQPGVRSWPEDGNFFPFHSACYEVLKVLASGRLGDRDNDHDDVDATMLFSFFRYMYSPQRAYCSPPPLESLELPYIDVDMDYECGPQGQFWEFRRGGEVYVSNPFDIPELRKYYMNLPRLPQKERQVSLCLKRKVDERADDDSFQSSQQMPKRQKGDPMHQDPASPLDPVARLPPELLTEIFIQLPAQSVVNLKIASPTARQLPLSNWFWWKRIKSAMPCLWDLPSFHGLTGSDNIGWHQVYKDLSTQGRGHGQGKILGLVNRHRIWSEGDMKGWFENKANSAEQDVADAILEWGDRQSFRDWRTARGQTMSGESLSLQSESPTLPDQPSPGGR